MAGLSSVPDVEIDSEGKFKYILVKVSEGANESKLIVRGTKQAEFHPDIFAKVVLIFCLSCLTFESVQVEPVMKTAGFDTEVQGGGKILHEPGKSIKVFSKSTGIFICNLST